MTKSLGSVGEPKAEASIGVGGTEVVGVGLEGKLVGGAIGRVKDSRLEFRRDAVDADRVDRVRDVSVWGGGDAIELENAPSALPLSPVLSE